MHDPNRLSALEQTGLMDSGVSEPFDRLTRLAARVLNAPIALVTLVDDSRQFFKSCVGLPAPLAAARQTPISHSFCQYVVASGKPLVVFDAHEHPVLKDNPVIPLGVLAYAGIPLKDKHGFTLGSFCVIDSKPRAWSEEEIGILTDLAAAVMDWIALRRRGEESERAGREKDQFLAFLSHELRTPLAPALMTIAAIEKDPELPEEFREDARLIRRNLEQEVVMIDDLLDVTRIATGKLHLHLQAVSVHELMEECAATFQSEAAARGIALKLEAGACEHHVEADAVKLKQVLCNLVKNSMKFTPAGGSITLRCANSAGGSLKVEVRDTGAGIAPSLLPKMFDTFTQGDRPSAAEQHGLGLGLAICKGIVEAHGGTIRADSAGVNCGTTVTIELPMKEVRLPKIAAVKPPTGPVRPVSILLVDDHEDTLRAMTRLLSKSRHRVTTAKTMTSALREAEKNTFDVLISDIGLPDGSGLDLIRQLQAQYPIKGIALTGYGMEADIENTRLAGFARHLVKPINFNELTQAIGELAV